MAKKTESGGNQQAEAQAAPQSDDLAVASRAVMDITGCGQLAAEERMRNDAELMAKIAQLERSEKRSEIVGLLF